MRRISSVNKNVNVLRQCATCNGRIVGHAEVAEPSGEYPNNTMPYYLPCGCSWMAYKIHSIGPLTNAEIAVALLMLEGT